MGHEGSVTHIKILPLGCPNIVTARKLGVPIYQLLGGKVRNTLRVYSWIGGDNPSEVTKDA